MTNNYTEFNRGEWLKIKKLQANKWPLDTILQYVPWSKATVKRTLEARTWPEYRRLMIKATESVRRRKAAQNWSDNGKYIAGGYIDTKKVNKYTVKPPRTTAELIAVAIVAIIIITSILLVKLR